MVRGRRLRIVGGGRGAPPRRLEYNSLRRLRTRNVTPKPDDPRGPLAVPDAVASLPPGPKGGAGGLVLPARPERIPSRAEGIPNRAEGNPSPS